MLLTRVRGLVLVTPPAAALHVTARKALSSSFMCFQKVRMSRFVHFTILRAPSPFLSGRAYKLLLLFAMFISGFLITVYTDPRVSPRPFNKLLFARMRVLVPVSFQSCVQDYDCLQGSIALQALFASH